MKIVINRTLLLNNLNHVIKAVSVKPQMPILTGIKLDVRENLIKITATNREISIQSIIEKNNSLLIESEGVVVVPGKYFYEIVRKLDAENVTITTFEENSIKIFTDKSTFTLNMLDKNIFPYIAFEDSDKQISIDSVNLKQIIKKTVFATSISESKMVLTGVSFTTKGDCLEAIATDSFRLAKKFIKYQTPLPEVSIIVPRKSLDELNKIVEEDEEIIEMHITKTKILFKYKNIMFISRLIEGTFPNTNSLIPVEYSLSLKLNKNEIMSAIERASLFETNDATNVLKLSLREDGLVEVNSTNNEIGGASEEVFPLETSSNITFLIAFSSKYFSDAVKAFDSNVITINFTGEIKPFIITGENDVNHIQLILPVRAS